MAGLVSSGSTIPYLCSMEITAARFLTSQTNPAKLPIASMPEYAFIGRSNVGKSSLINMLVGRKGLAKASSTPGKTQVINHFLVNESWYLVDLPGYGFAKISRTQREAWDTMIRTYLISRPNLQCVFQLIDSRLEPQQNDLDFLTWLGEKEIPVALVFTKADKQGLTKTQSLVAAYKKVLRTEWAQLPPIFITSAENGIGREELATFIQEVNDKWEPLPAAELLAMEAAILAMEPKKPEPVEEPEEDDWSTKPNGRQAPKPAPNLGPRPAPAGGRGRANVQTGKAGPVAPSSKQGNKPAGKATKQTGKPDNQAKAKNVVKDLAPWKTAKFKTEGKGYTPDLDEGDDLGF